MSRRSKGHCGTAKVPGVDHASQLAGIEAELGSVAQMWAAGGRPVSGSARLVDDPDATTGITTRVRAGGPGPSDPPEIVGLYEFSPSRRVRRAVED